MAPKINENWFQNRLLFSAAFRAIFFGFRTLSGRSLAAVQDSWGPLVGTQERKNADGCMRKPLFQKSVFSLLAGLLRSLWVL